MHRSLIKKSIALALAVLVAVVFIMPLSKANGDVVTKTIKLKIGSKTVYINGQPKQMDVAPFIDPHSNRTLVPVRFVAEGLGGKVSWHPHERFVGVLVGKKKVGLWIGKKTAKISKQTGGWDRFDILKNTVTDQAPEIVPPGRTMIPLRFVSESVGAKVDWNGQTREITITLSYVPTDVGDMLFAVPFDNGAVNNTTGWAMNPGSNLAVVPEHNALFVYGQKRKKMNVNNDEMMYDWYHEYLFKYDDLTGIRIAEKIIFDNADPGWYGSSSGYAIVNWLSYDHGYLYCATPNFHFNDPTFQKTVIYIKKVNPVTMSIIWAKTYNISQLFYKDFVKGVYLSIHDDNRVPLRFTPDGSKMVMIFSTGIAGINKQDVQRVKKGFSTSYDFVNLIGFNTKTGNIIWTARHDGWSYYCVDPNRMPMYKGRYLYMFENIIDVQTWCYQPLDKPDPGKYSGYYNYQTIYFTKLREKLVKETHAKANLRPPYKNIYAPERLLCVDMNTGKTVWQKYFIDNWYGGYIPASPDLSLVNGVVYLPETIYDPGVSFSNADPRDENFGVELLGFDAMTGKLVFFPHKPYGAFGPRDYAPIVFNVNGKPQVLDATVGTYMVQNQYMFISIQCGGQFYDPNFPNKLVGWESYFYFAPISNLVLKEPENAGFGTSTLLKNYYAVLKHFSWRYYKASRTPKVFVHNETPNSGLTDVTMRYANGNIYIFFRWISEVIPKYPAVVCIKAEP